jgi:hypothetical protein
METGPFSETRQEPVATFRMYADARHAADLLVERGFPAVRLSIVGVDVHLVRRCAGRWVWGHTVAVGLAVGGLAGFMIGLMLSLVTTSFIDTAELVVWTAVWGSALGVALASFTHAAAGSPRCIFGRGRLVPQQYELRADAESAARARHLLSGPTPLAVMRAPR